ncbi:MAG: hypothetical protein OES13_06910 [Acidimicrobiia bacterium]|nr:hypothetical protein [Acidimicrobiia bacterium]
MMNRLRIVGIILLVIGVLFMVGGGVAFSKVQDGYGSLAAFSEAQGVELSYNEDGQLIDRGTTEGADAIMTLLTDDWGFSPVSGDLDPGDPLVNTATEFMYQMATINYHVLHGTQTIVLTEDAEFEGEAFPAGTYEFEVDGRYWTDFNRSHPLEGPARSQAWTGTVHGLVGELGVGTVTHSVLQIGLGIAAILAGIGFLSMLTGGGLVWASRSKGNGMPGVPDTIPESMSKFASTEA